MREIRGFTLIEVLVVMAIILIISTMVYLGFKDYADQQVFTGYVNEVALAMKEQRQKAIAGSNDVVHGVYVGTTSVVMFAGGTYMPGDVGNVALPYKDGIIATSSLSGGVWELVFSRLTGEPTATGTLVFNDSKGVNHATLTIQALGVIE